MHVLLTDDEAYMIRHALYEYGDKLLTDGHRQDGYEYRNLADRIKDYRERLKVGKPKKG